MKNIFALFLAVASLLFVNGCATTSGGGAADESAVFSNGELKDTLNVPLQAAGIAAVAAARDLQFTIVNDAQNPARTQITARTAGDKTVDISLYKQTPNLTGISIRAGAGGDEQLSRDLLAKIKARL